MYVFLSYYSYLKRKKCYFICVNFHILDGNHPDCYQIVPNSQNVSLNPNSAATADEPMIIDLTEGLRDDRFREVYVKLKKIFPDVKKRYLKNVCNQCNFDNYGNEDHLLNSLIDYLLVHGSNHMKLKAKPTQEPLPAANISTSVDDQCEYLAGIFSDIDPTFLREFVEKNANNAEGIELFIRGNLANPNYPTVRQYLEKLKVTEQVKQYTTDFKVESFLEMFPDPVGHFENVDRNCCHHPVAFEFLKSFFKKHKVDFYIL